MNCIALAYNSNSPLGGHIWSWRAVGYVGFCYSAHSWSIKSVDYTLKLTSPGFFRSKVVADFKVKQKQAYPVGLYG
uniref:Uncharacterized protein n=1 Tax=Anguilla anguilla TaxID=7936 RepID=A0A0E9WRT0_ANGAN